LVVHFIDVGQGDATLITAPTGERLLIDGGRSRPLIRERLRSLGVTELNAVIATHADADHLAGLLEVLDLYQVKRIYYHAERRTTATYHNFVRAARAERAQIIDPRRGDQILLGNLVLAVLNPGAILRGDSNADSIVVRLSCGAVDVLLMADAEAPSEQDMLAAGVIEELQTKVATALTNTDGSYIIRFLAPGTYNVTVEGVTTVPGSRSVTVGEAQAVTGVNFTIQ